MSKQLVEYVSITETISPHDHIIHSCRFKAYSKLVQHIAGACAALYELITGEEAPKFKDALRG